ncbi:TerB family tellurite resistance protein [Arvimicrobium flavum]|uniref:tellurite resistance TerB family protein n=1 Tax=Arvimicrobium flavum TaxID=3393320 RepID=UPI00237B3A2C|nr:TerB family tellurite resistance protein [Mesorhizobium shangrilense]
MLERLLTFLRDLPHSAGKDPGDDCRIAAAALLFHVMDADGVRQDVERERIKTLLADAYGLDGPALERLLLAGEKADNEAIDFYAFTSVLKRHLDEEERVDFIRLMWEVCYADGELHELEDNTLWRVAELIGVGGRDRIAARQSAQRRTGSNSVN